MSTVKLIPQYLFLIVIFAVASFAQAEPEGSSFDQFGKISADSMRERLDSFFVVLKNDPDSEGFIEIFIDRQSKKQNAFFPLELAIKHMEFRGFDKSRITFSVSAGNKQQTILWLVPPRAKFPYSKSHGDPSSIVRAEEFDRKALNKLRNKLF